MDAIEKGSVVAGRVLLDETRWKNHLHRPDVVKYAGETFIWGLRRFLTELNVFWEKLSDEMEGLDNKILSVDETCLRLWGQWTLQVENRSTLRNFERERAVTYDKDRWREPKMLQKCFKRRECPQVFLSTRDGEAKLKHKKIKRAAVRRNRLIINNQNWSQWSESNRWPIHYEWIALPTELHWPVVLIT